MRRGPLWFISTLLVCSPFAHAQTPAPAKAVVEGDVINVTTGAPIGQARVRLNNLESDPLFAKADERGHFHFSGIEPGFYFLTARSPGFMATAGLTMGLTIPLAGQRPQVMRERFPLPAGASPPTITTGPDGAPHCSVKIPLVAYAVISGRLTDPYGVPLVGSNIQLLEKIPVTPAGQQNEFQTKAQGRTDDKGEFRIANLEPGTYLLAASDQGGITTWESTYRTTYYPASIAMASAKPLVLAAGQRLRAEFKIVQQAGVQVAGRVIKPQGPEYAGEARILTSIVLVSEPGDTPGARRPLIAVEDDYQLKDVLPGKYTLFAVSQKVTANPFGGEPNEILGLVRHIEVGEHDIDNVDLALAPLREVSGQVTFREGCAPVPVRIAPYSNGPFGPAASAAETDGEGKFVLQGMIAGRYSFTVDPEARNRPSLPVESIMLGDRDVLKDGFESPYAGDEPLRITVGCSASGRAQ